MSERIQEEIRKHVATRAKAPGRTPWKDKFPQEYALAKEMLQGGHHLRFIADYFGVSYETVRRPFEREGLIELRPRVTWRKRIPGAMVNPGSGCPCGMGMREICAVHKLK